MARASASKTRMNSLPITLRLVSGSVTPLSAARNWSATEATRSATPVEATKSVSTCSASPLRRSPWSTNTQVSWSPTARCTRAAATAESTPPDRPQTTRLSPTWARIRAIWSVTMLTIVQVGRQPAPSSRKRSSTRWPCSLCSTSGWNCTPYNPRSGSSNEATGVASVEDVTVKPGGAWVTASPCDIQTLIADGRPDSSTPGSTTASAVRPYSAVPVRATWPPSEAAMAWNP